MPILFLQPGFLFLGLLALVFWVGPLRARRPVHGLIRSLVWLVLVLALAHPVWKHESGSVHRVVVLDRSASLINDPAAALTGKVFGAGTDWSLLELGEESTSAIELPDRVRHQVLSAGPGASDLGRALEWAAAAIPLGEAGGVVLVSDGLSTDGLPAAGISQLLSRGLPLSWAAPKEPEGDVRAVDLVLPKGDGDGARVGLPCTVWAHLEGSGQVLKGTLVERDPMGGAETVLASFSGTQVDGLIHVPLSFEPSRPGFLNLELRVQVESGQDARPGDLELARTLAVQDPLSVVYLGERMQGGADRLQELVGPGFALKDVNEAALEESLDRADLVVLDDRPSQALGLGMQDKIVDAVTQKGLGLVTAGGESAFGPGGYHNQPLETLLPVEMVQKEEKRDPSTSLVLIIDTSGSMGGNRVQLAKQVSRLSIRRLLPHDKVGIVEFYGAKRWAVPLQPASNSIEIERALNRLDAGGGTVILPAIEEAYYGLKNVRTRYKHVLILTDGGVETGAFEPLLRRMADDGINVSTVLVGPDAHSEFLVNIANWGQGRFYSVPNRFNLPEILLKQPASAKLPAYRPGLADVTVHGGRGWWGDLDPRSVPPVDGYVETRLRPGAERLIETAREQHPILASWRFGLGRVSAMTTEPTGPGTEGWRDWTGYGKLLARVMLRTASDGAEPFAFAVERQGDRARVVCERRHGGQALPAIRRVDGPTDAIALRQVSTDRFEGSVILAADEELRLLCGAEGSPRPPVRLALQASVKGQSERQVARAVAQNLSGLCERTGGAVLTDLDADGWARELENLPVGEGANPRGALPLAPMLALLALLLYLLDLLYRRMPRTRS